MSALLSLAQSASLVEPLGWMLIHSLWQGLLLSKMLLTSRRTATEVPPRLGEALQSLLSTMQPALGVRARASLSTERRGEGPTPDLQ